MSPVRVSPVTGSAGVRYNQYLKALAIRLRKTALSPNMLAAPPAVAKPETRPGWFKIRRLVSPIGLPEYKKQIFRDLGLHRPYATVYHPHVADVADKILTVKECVEVQNVASAPGPYDVANRLYGAGPRRKPPNGFTVVGKFEPGKPVLGLRD
ncbi:MAG: hypothetical protein BJ554DRAFT_6103 [Olpidium bornovanus]|uniref:Large ribosomal subunit protein uL30-like ferredoxin-like fold domain-containing protein n=1 Tax=Olpidium bornovanus TaxID=278681 RepID=A0A8H8DMC7_9FUNG|nr:MAG: hypothetical protein BJ554DRAFT_6103 [Olpidium bornovanus]